MVAPTGIEMTPLISDERAAAVCIIYKGSVCLGHRTEACAITGSSIPYAGYWAPFGGTVENGEGPMGTAVRELKEETGIEIKISDLSYISEIVNENGSTYVLYAFHSPLLIFPELNFEHTEFGYFTIDSLNSSPNPICPKVAEALILYEERRWRIN